MAPFCSLVGLVFGSSSLSAEEALASHGERCQLPPAAAAAAALQSSGKKRGRKTAPEAADEHQEDGEVPPPVSKATALLEKGKEKVSTQHSIVFFIFFLFSRADTTLYSS
ncbi:hypothetical protein ABZP36_009951 [Zizania latifolia]